MNNDLPLVSLIIVVRNEIQYIEVATASLINQDYPREKLELIFVDGCSTDGTKQVLEEIVNRLKNSGYHDVKLIDNPKMILAAGWNLAIQAASGDIVCRIDAHSEIDPCYVSNGVNRLRDSSYDNVVCVGGVIVRNIGLKGMSVVAADMFSSKFGIGNSPFRNKQVKPIQSDTAVFGLYYKWIFNEIGYFDEKLERNQDLDFHKRVKEKGYVLLTDPQLQIKYYVRTELKSLVKKAYGDGYWTMKSNAYRLRHLIPGLFFIYLVCLPLVVVIDIKFGSLLILYIFLSVLYAIKDGSTRKSRMALPMLYFTYHICYGFGSVRGLLNRLLTRRMEKD